jgi:uroporphyrin-3 C-methyltransferase
MSKEDSSSDKEKGPEGLASSPDSIQVADSEVELEIEASGEDETSPALEIEVSGEDETSPALEIEASGEDETSPSLEDEGSGEAETSPVDESEGSGETKTPLVAGGKGSGETETPPEAKPDQPVPPKPRRSWFGLFNFLLILLLAGAAGYYWWQQQQIARDYETTIGELQQQLEGKAGNARLDSSLSPLKGDISSLGRKIDELGVEQQGLRESSEKLYELYGRDKNDWQLAEVEYLMRVAQHKLILQDDFEGAAITLQAASDRIALTGDPGLLPVRVMISEEIADLKTRKRADLVGMTLILAQLRRQVRVLEPGFALRVDETASEPQQVETSQDWFDRFNAFIDSLVKVRNEATQPTEIEANIADVSETLEDNLKLARWAVLERDGRQYQRLIEQSLRLFREFYDLDNAANNDFMTQLQELQKMELKPEKPDITGSLRELLRILSQRETAPQPAATEAPEPDNG